MDNVYAKASPSSGPLPPEGLPSAETLVQAVLKDTESVSLWLGANVMLEYPLGEACPQPKPSPAPLVRAQTMTCGSARQAKELLARNYSNAQTNLDSIKRELAVIRDSVTILEVSIARVYNHDVSKRRATMTKETE